MKYLKRFEVNYDLLLDIGDIYQSSDVRAGYITQYFGSVNSHIVYIDSGIDNKSNGILAILYSDNSKSIGDYTTLYKDHFNKFTPIEEYYKENREIVMNMYKGLQETLGLTPINIIDKWEEKIPHLKIDIESDKFNL